MKNYQYDFLKSALSKNGEYIKTVDVLYWLKKQHDEMRISINKISFDALNSWNIERASGHLSHVSKRYFSIDGIRVKTNWGLVHQWDQPIINQPEIGYLGFIVKEIAGVLHFLVQAKIEPGNVNYIQLSPTLQATKSNYEQVHKGLKPKYIEYFQNATSDQILLDQLQSEQGARFLKKRNRNIIIRIDEEIKLHENFIWLTLAQLKELMKFDNIVNMDSRTVISGIPLGQYNMEVIEMLNFLKKTNDITERFLKSALATKNSLHSIDEIISFITNIKSTNNLQVQRIPLYSMNDWVIKDNEISHRQHMYFKIIAVEVEIYNREVTNWSQPMVEPAQKGLCAFICKEINNILHFIVQGKMECGNHDIIELAPTVQTLTGDYRKTPKNSLPFLECVLNTSKENIFYDTMQSEEGGRFYKEQNRNMIVYAGDEVSQELPNNYIWMTIEQLNTFMKFNNYLNIQARSLLAAIPYV